MSNAIKLGSFFVTKAREGAEVSDKTFVSLKDDAPKWLHEAIRAAHNGDLPNDWIYAECEAACDAIDAGDLGTDPETDGDALHGYADGRVEIYTGKVFQWLADMWSSSTYSEAEERAKELGDRGGASIEEIVKATQYCAIEAIASAMLAAARENGVIAAE